MKRPPPIGVLGLILLQLPYKSSSFTGNKKTPRGIYYMRRRLGVF